MVDLDHVTFGLEVNQEIIAVFQISLYAVVQEVLYSVSFVFCALERLWPVSLLLFFSVCKNVYACINVKFIS